MTDRQYTLSDIRSLWKRYKGEKVLRRLIAGKWEFMRMKGKGMPQLENATRAEVVDISREIGFPEYVEKYGNT